MRFLLLFVLLFLPGSLWGQDLMKERSATVQALIDVADSIRVGQEAYKEKHGRYAWHPDSLGVEMWIDAHENKVLLPWFVTVHFMAAGDDDWGVVLLLEDVLCWYPWRVFEDGNPGTGIQLVKKDMACTQPSKRN